MELGGLLGPNKLRVLLHLMSDELAVSLLLLATRHKLMFYAIKVLQELLLSGAVLAFRDDSL